MWFPSGGEWIIVLLVLLLLFGAKRLPDLARSLGRSVSEFKKGTKELTDEINAEPKPPEAGKTLPDKDDKAERK